MDAALKKIFFDPLADTVLAFVIFIFIVAVIRIFVPHRRSLPAPSPAEEWHWDRLVFAVVAALTFALTLYLGGNLAVNATIDLEADMQIAAGAVTGAYVNDTSITPMQLPVVPGARHVYRFANIPRVLSYLRIDPTIAPDATVLIYGVTILSEGQVVRRFTPADLKSWTLYNLKEVPGDPAAYSLTTTSAASLGSFLATNLSLVASHRPGWLLYILEVFRREHLYPVALVACFLLFLAAGVSSSAGFMDATLVAAIAAIASPVAALIEKLPMSPQSVSVAISNASYAGYPKSLDHLVSVAILLVSVVFAWLAARYGTVRASSPIPEQPGRLPEPSWNRWDFAPAILLLLLLALYLPDIRNLVTYLGQIEYRPLHWDYSNFTWWAQLIQRGYLPYRDFWYPYSGFYANSLPLPVGPIAAFLQNVIALWLLYLGLRYAIGRRPGIIAVSVLLIPIVLNEFLAWYRYVLGIEVGLFYVALQRAERWEWPRHLGLALASGFVFFYEPTQLIYAGAGILAHTVVAAVPAPRKKWDFIAIRSRARRLLRQRLVYIGLPMMAGALPVVVFLAASGMLPGFLHYQASVGDQALYASQPAPMISWTLPALRFEALFLVPFLALALGFYAWFRDHSRAEPSSIAVLVTGVAGFMALQKDIVRPVLQQVEVYPCVAIILYVLSTWRRRNRLQTIPVALFFGFAAAVAQYEGCFRNLYQAAERAPAALAGDYDVLLHPREAEKIVNTTLYSPARFTAYASETAVVNTLKRDFGWSQAQPVYVLGDASVLYILMGCDFPYNTNNYNSSPIYEQERVIDWLRRRRPRFVIWDPTEKSFDTVPNVLRVPLFYQFVVENYTYARTVGPYEILRSVGQRSSTDADYWQQRLGRDLDLGSIPRLSPLSRYHSCPIFASQSCGRLVSIRTPPETTAGKGWLSVDSVSGKPYLLMFDVSVGERDYVIDLDRFWFRSFIPASARIVVSVPGAEVHDEFSRRDPGILY